MSKTHKRVGTGKWMKGRIDEKSNSYKGEEAGKVAKHYWIVRKLGKRSFCEMCKRTDKKNYDWSNKDHKYRQRIDDWQRLCRSCHRKYDYKYNK